MRWFRFYEDAMNDPKVQRLHPKLFKHWINLLCLASKNGGSIKSADDAAFALRVNEQEAAIIVTELAVAGLLDKVDGGYLEPHNWCSRQYKSDVSTNRVKEFRERQRNVSETVSETKTKRPQRQSTDTETESKGSELRSAPAKDRKKPSTSIPDDWRPSNELRQFARGRGVYDRKFDLEMEKFRNHARMHDRKCVKWDMAARNWLLGEIDRKNISPPKPMQQAIADAGLIQIHEGTEEMDAWDRHWRQTKGVNAPRSKHGGIFVETQWPPGEPHARNADADQSPRP